MPKPIVDGRRAAQGELHINTAPIVGKIPNPIIKLLVRQIQKIVADSGYVNVTVTIKKAPPLEEAIDSQGQVTLKLRNDGSGLKGPVIEITTLDGLMAGEYTLAMTRDGFMARIPPPRQLLKSASWRGNKTSPAQPAAIGYGQAPRALDVQKPGYGQAPQGFGVQEQGYGQAPRGFGAQEQGYRQPPRTLDAKERGYRQPPRGLDAQTQGSRQPPRGFGAQEQGHGPARTDPGRFYSSAPVGAQPPRPVPAQRMPTSTTPRRAPVPVNAFSQGQPQSGYGQSQGQQGFDQNSKREKSSGGCCCFGGGSGSEQHQRGNGQAPGQQGFDKNSKREKGSSGGCCFGSGSGGASEQSQRGNGQLRGQQQGFDNNSKREKSGGGCCFGGSKDSSRPPARSAYDKLGESNGDRKKREKKERKRAENMAKKQKKKGKTSGFGGPEKSGFYDDNRKSSRGCCGLSCC